MTGARPDAAPVAAAYGQPYRVRFDEAGPDGHLRASGLLGYAQDVAWRHSEARGYDRAWYAERRLAWLVRAAEVEVVDPIPMGTTVEVTTAVAGFRRVWARRRSEVRLPDGRAAASVLTDWVLVDERGAVVRIPAEFGDAFPGGVPDIALLRVAVPEPPTDATASLIVVRRHDLDPNDHPNNAVYLDWLEEAVLATGDPLDGLFDGPTRYRLEYATAALPGEALQATTWRGADGWWHLLRGADGRICVRGHVARLDGV